MNKLKTLKARRQRALDAARAITDRYDADADMSAADATAFDSLMAQVEALDAEIHGEEDFERQLRDAPAVEFDEPGASRGYGHFRDGRDYIKAVLKAGNPRLKSIDDRLLIGAAPTTYGNEGVGEDGGYLVPPQLANEIGQYSLESNALIDWCNSIPVSGNLLSLPVSEATPWGSSGVQVYWEGEGQQLTQSKPAFEGRELRLRKLTALVPVTNELLEDATALAAWLPRELGNAARYAVNDAIVNGSGTGKPQGFTQSGSLVTQTKETSQTADTIVAGNIAKMYARCSNPSAAVWIVNPDAWNQLPLMTIGDQPVWTPVNDGMKSSPGGMLLGRPVILSDAAQTLGDAGDIYFADLSSYVVIQKQGSPKIATSMHLYFDYDMTAFRLTLRIDGQSMFRNPVTPPNSSVTRSPFVRLESRA